MNAQMNIELEPVWNSARLAREQSRDFLQQQGLSDQTIQILSMVACELMENAIKYANAQTGANIRLYLKHVSDYIEVEVSSYLGLEESSHFERLQKTIDWLGEFEDPMDAYVARMQEVALAEDDVSGLGLARIAFEGESSLSCEWDPEQNLHVRAMHRLD